MSEESERERADTAEARASALTREIEAMRRSKVTAERIASNATQELAAVRTLALAERAEATRTAEALAQRMEKAEAQLDAMMRELGGWTLSMLPPNAYGGSLASIYSDIRAGRIP
jgi:hypothetical protein